MLNSDIVLGESRGLLKNLFSTTLNTFIKEGENKLNSHNTIDTINYCSEFLEQNKHSFFIK